MSDRLRDIRGSTATPRGRALLAAIPLLCLALPADAADFSYAKAAEPYKGSTIRVLDEVTPLQEALSKLIPDFEKETGIKVTWELLSHGDVINKGQADMLSGRGYYDAVMLHGFQMGPLLTADAIRPIDDLVKNPKLSNPGLDTADFIEKPYKSLAFHGGKQYGFINWNYNQVYWARADLLGDAGEQAAFKAKYGYDLGPARTLEQMRDIAQFFTRKKGQTLAGKTLETDFYGVVLEGVKGGTTFLSLWNNFMSNFGGGIVDAKGAPAFDQPANVEAIRLWAEMWKYAPPGIAEYSLIDVPTVMGNGIAAQTIAYSDFILGIDRPGVSPYSGKFVYGPVPPKAGREAQRTTESEPSLTVISNGSRNPEAAFLFLQWLTEKRQQDRLLAEGKGGVPIRESSWAAPVMQQEQLKSLFEAMKASIEVAEAKPKMPQFYELYDVLTGISQEIGLGRLTPEEGAKKAQAEMLKICTNCLL